MSPSFSLLMFYIADSSKSAFEIIHGNANVNIFYSINVAHGSVCFVQK